MRYVVEADSMDRVVSKLFSLEIFRSDERH